MGSPCWGRWPVGGQGASWSPQRCRVGHRGEVQDVSPIPQGQTGPQGAHASQPTSQGSLPSSRLHPCPTLFPGSPVCGFSVST